MLIPSLWAAWRVEYLDICRSVPDSLYSVKLTLPLEIEATGSLLPLLTSPTTRFTILTSNRRAIFMALVVCTGLDEALLNTRRRILEVAGHKVITVTDERFLVEALKVHSFDVAVIGQAVCSENEAPYIGTHPRALSRC